jgi:hypothetical protein
MDIFGIKIVSLTALFGSWAVVTGGVWKLFDRIEKVASQEAKENASQWLLQLKMEDHFTNWANTFSEAFDNIFGARHFSWRCFYRSAIASLIAVIVVTLFWGYIRTEEFLSFVGDSDFFEDLFFIFLVTAILNMLPDYISLLESRYIISFLRKSHSVFKHIALIFADLILTSLIGFIAFGILSTALDENIINYFLSFVLPLSAEKDGDPSLGIWFYSTFFTSVWIWIYILSGICLFSQKRTKLFVAKFNKFFDIKNKPFMSMVGAAIIIITVAYIVVIPIVLAFIGG